MYNVSQDLLDALRATPEVLEGLLEGCTQEQASTARGGDEGWSVIEVICDTPRAKATGLLVPQQNELRQYEDSTAY